MVVGTAVAIAMAWWPAGPADEDALTLDAYVAKVRSLAAADDDTGLADYLDGSMVAVPGSWFRMGSVDGRGNERPARGVYVDGFAMDRYEVTNAQYRRYVIATGEPAPPYWAGDHYPTNQADHPVLGVSWIQADGYCRWAGKRLPTEAEWELSCRGPEGFTYPWGDAWDEAMANVAAQPLPHRADAFPLLASGTPAGEAFPEPIGSHLGGASAYGILDLCGNAAEWVADWYDPYAYRELPAENPVGVGPPADHVIRGSAWLFPHDAPEYVPDISRCAFRNDSHVYADPRMGFRCADSG